MMARDVGRDGSKPMILIQPSPCTYQLGRLSAGTLRVIAQEESRMRFYNRQHRHYCGIDLHVKTMYICILDAAGQVLVHRNVTSSPEAFLDIVAPYLTTWSWPPSACSRGTGSRTGAPLKASRSSWGTRSR